MHCKMKENLLRKHSDCMRNTHFRALISPYKKKSLHFKKSAWNIQQRTWKGYFREYLLRTTYSDASKHWCCVSAAPTHLMVGSEVPLHACQAGNHSMKWYWHENKDPFCMITVQLPKPRLVIFATCWVTPTIKTRGFGCTREIVPMFHISLFKQAHRRTNKLMKQRKRGYCNVILLWCCYSENSK